MKKFFRWSRRLDLEDELRAGRPEPRRDFVTALAGEVRRRPIERTRMGRVGVALALTGLILVSVASFGGVGYASSSGSQDMKQPSGAKSAAEAQYGKESPVFKPPKSHKASSVAAPTSQVSTVPSSNQLPFTGLALWIPLAVGLVLIGLGLTLRIKSRRRDTTAH